ncbi:MAG: hypothetical protein F6K23_33670 [Okeania sp. SIO2C9]|nr:hypothetical protein [Okeania sp. SIO2C9]NEQ77530.1 hypothetical protein [Okeania sp. SIO2C9]
MSGVAGEVELDVGGGMINLSIFARSSEFLFRQRHCHWNGVEGLRSIP